MLFKGAGKRANLKDDLTALGASWNGTTTAESTRFYETVSTDPARIDAVLRIEADRFLRARFTAGDLAREMPVVRNELENSDQVPLEVLGTALAHANHRWHGYSRDTIGARSDVESMSMATLRAFYRTHYRPDNAVLIVSGHFDSRRVLRLASDLFARARNPAQPRAVNRTWDPPMAATHRSEITLSAGTTMAASSWKLPGFAQRDAHALDLAANAICDPDWGSLRQALVIEEKLAVAAACAVSVDTDYGTLTASARAPQKGEAAALSAALSSHIETAARQGATPEQLALARTRELNSLERSFDSHDRAALLLSEAETAGDWRLAFWQIDVIRTITLEEANAALKKWVVATNRADAIIRQADSVSALQIAASPPVAPLVSNGHWKDLVKEADPAPTSLKALAQATRTIELEGERVRAAFITRKTQGDKVWFLMVNDYGSPQTLFGRGLACSMASALMEYGGAGLSRKALETRMEALSATWSLDLDGISLQVPPGKLSDAFATLMAVWADPLLPREEFERMRASSLARTDARLKNPQSVANNAVARRFDNFPKGHPGKPRSITERAQALAALTYEEVQRCAHDFAGIGHVRIGAVGNLTEADLRALWAKTASIPRSTMACERILDPRAPVAVDTTPIVVSMPDKPNASVSGTAVIALNDRSPDRAPLAIAIEALGDGSNSRIWKQLREQMGLSYSAGASVSGSNLEERSSVVLYATSSSEKAQDTLQALKSVLAKALEEGFTAGEIEAVKKEWALLRKQSLGDENRYPARLAGGLLEGLDYAWQAQYDEAIARVTAAQATAALRKYLGQAPIVWAVGKGSPQPPAQEDPTSEKPANSEARAEEPEADARERLSSRSAASR
jgi:zinc protease